MRNLRYLFALLAVLGLAAPAAATTYYVDPTTGSNSNSGTSRTTAWAGVPTSGGSGSGWKKLVAGDNVLIRRGARFTAPLTVKSDWYATNASKANPISVTPDPEWGSGAVTWDGAGILVQYIHGFNLDGLQRGGVVIQNAPGRGVEAIGVTTTDRLRGLRLGNIRVYRAADRHVSLQKVDGFMLEKVDVDGGGILNGSSGICLGEDGDRGCSNGQLLGCTASNMGPASYTQGSGTNNYQGFWIVNDRNIYLDGCDGFHNSGRGFDCGGVGSAGVAMSDNITFYRCRAYNNGNDGFGSSAEDYPESEPSRHYYYYCLAYGNGGGGWQIYEGPTCYMYNCVSDRNLTAVRLWGVNPTMGWNQGRKAHIYIYNCVLSRPTAGSGEAASGTVFVGYVNQLDLHMDYNFYVQGASPNAAVWGYFYPGPAVFYGYNASESPGGRRKWFIDHGCDEHSLCSMDGRVVGFTNPDSGDFHLSSNSDCLDAGTNVGLTQDFEINTVPQNGAVDIGAFEALASGGQQQPVPPRAPTGLRAVPE
ncbi:MAG: choice-of-anchor Q domain-containing protein [Pseudomonadota bacterium]